QQGEKSRKVLGVECFRWRELPKRRTKFRLELQHTARKEPVDRFAGLGQNPTMCRKPRAFEREDKIIRRLVGPAPKACRLLRAVECAVDLDRSEFAACKVEFARLRQTLGIKNAAPWRENPTPDADADHRAATCIPGWHDRGPGSIP